MMIKQVMLCDITQVPSHTNNATKATNNKEDKEVTYETMVSSYTIDHSSQLYNSPSGAIHATYRMVKEDATHDL